jgi:hypothetical protein
VPIRLSNGTRIDTGPDWACVTLPNGREIHARPNDESAGMASRLGYGRDVAAMTREHDPLHARLTDMLGLPYSVSLMTAAGCLPESELAGLEEDAVLAVQIFLQAARRAGLVD